MRLLLLSGGIDSAALACWTRPDVCLTIDYGQAPARGEVAAAAAVSRHLALRHEVLTVDLRHLGSGLMSGKEPSALAGAEEWWPYRNQMLITLAAMRFVSDGLREIMIGAVATDIHADGKPPFLDAIDRTLSLQEGGVRVTAPGLRHTTLDLLRLARFPRDLLGVTFSCHAMEVACGQCGGCIKHLDTLRRLDAAETAEQELAPGGSAE